MKITKIVIVTGLAGTDSVRLYTDLNSPLRAQDSEPLVLGFEAPVNAGLEFCRQNFPDIPIEVVNAATGTRTRYRYSNA